MVSGFVITKALSGIFLPTLSTEVERRQLPKYIDLRLAKTIRLIIIIIKSMGKTVYCVIMIRRQESMLTAFYDL